jgi:N-acetylmuramoyl-L-alanine amidase
VTAWVNDYVVKNKFSRPGLAILKVLGVVIHWTATPGATDENEKKFFDGADGGGSRYASAHIFVDRDSARCIIPLNEVAYHANEKPSKVTRLRASTANYKSGNANLNTIGVEMCVEKDGTIHPDTVKRTVDVVVELCKQFGLSPLNDVYRHYDITGKNCPAPWVTNGQLFVGFKQNVKAKLEGESVGVGGDKVQQGIGVLKVLDNTVIRDKPVYLGAILGNVKPNEEYIVHDYSDGWYNIGGWVYKQHVIFTPHTNVKITKG